MKKFIIFISILFTVFFSHNSKSQTIDSVSTTVPILCYGDLATVNVYITQTSPATPIKLMNYRFATPTFLVKLAASSWDARCGFNGTFLTGDLKNFNFLTSSFPFIRLPFIFVTSAE